jgi:hypothetical protein
MSFLNANYSKNITALNKKQLFAPFNAWASTPAFKSFIIFWKKKILP